MSQNEVEQDLKSDPWVQELCHIICACRTDEELLLRLLRDVFSFSEIKKASTRVAIAWSLLEGKAQIQTAKDLGLSTKTVNNMARWVKGYEATGGIVTAYKLLHSDQESSQE